MTGQKWILPLLMCAACSISLSPLASRVMAGDLSLTIVYDNNVYDKNLETRWGFSCHIKGPEKTLLFDVGGEGPVLLNNMEKLKINPRSVNAVVLSHIHHDHIGGLSHFLKINPDVTVYMPRSFPPSVKDAVRQAGACLAEIHDPFRICKDVYSTGELGTFINEESLVVKTARGLVIITGCAHPGIVKIIEKSQEILKTDVYMVLGGFHLCWMNLSQVKKIISGVKKAGCRKVAPCHCSGNLARAQFEEVYGQDFVSVGAGKIITIKDAF